jgi:hypothetical protein
VPNAYDSMVGQSCQFGCLSLEDALRIFVHRPSFQHRDEHPARGYPSLKFNVLSLIRSHPPLTCPTYFVYQPTFSEM